MKQICLLIALILIPGLCRGQLSQLVYLKTDASNAEAIVPFTYSPTESMRSVYDIEFDASLFPFQDPNVIPPALDNGFTNILYDSDMDVSGHFATGGTANVPLEPVVNSGEAYVFSLKNQNVTISNLFVSSPAVSNTDTSSIFPSTFLLTYTPATNELKMPFHCSCLDYQGEGPDEHIFLHGFDHDIGLSYSGYGRYNTAWMSDSTVVMTLNIYNDGLINWEESYSMGDRYWGTFWVKINPFTGFHIVSDMLSQSGTALDYSLNAAEDGNHLYRTGMVRGNGVQMSPDGTTWDTFEGDSLYYAYVIKENGAGEQSWMTKLFSYQNTTSDSIKGPRMQRFITSRVIEIDDNAYLGSAINLSESEQGGDLIFNDYMSGWDTIPYTGQYAHQLAVRNRQIVRFGTDGQITEKLFFPYRNADANAFDNLIWYFQTPELFKVNDKLGWPFTYTATGDTTLYFLKKYPDGSLDSTGVDLPAGRGTFLLWLDADLSIVDVMNIPFSTGGNAFAEGVSIREVSLYHEDSLMISGTISSGTTTTMDPEEIAGPVTYDVDKSFVAFYSLPETLTGIETALQPEKVPIRLYPNPARDYITVKSEYPFSVNYHVLDLSGRRIDQGEIPDHQNFGLNVDGFEPGMYLLVLMKNQAHLGTKKFIVY